MLTASGQVMRDAFIPPSCKQQETLMETNVIVVVQEQQNDVKSNSVGNCECAELTTTRSPVGWMFLAGPP